MTIYEPDTAELEIIAASDRDEDRQHALDRQDRLQDFTPSRRLSLGGVDRSGDRPVIESEAYVLSVSRKGADAPDQAAPTAPGSGPSARADQPRSTSSLSDPQHSSSHRAGTVDPLPCPRTPFDKRGLDADNAEAA